MCIVSLSTENHCEIIFQDNYKSNKSMGKYLIQIQNIFNKKKDIKQPIQDQWLL